MGNNLYYRILNEREHLEEELWHNYEEGDIYSSIRPMQKPVYGLENRKQFSLPLSSIKEVSSLLNKLYLDLDTEEKLRVLRKYFKIVSEREEALRCPHRIFLQGKPFAGCRSGENCNFSFGRTVKGIGDFPALCWA